MYILPHPMLTVDVVHVVGTGSIMKVGRSDGNGSGCRGGGTLAACMLAARTKA